MTFSSFFTYKNPFFLFLLLTIFYVVFLGSHPLLLPDEGRYTEVAREMLASRDFITPHLDGSVFFHKPILFYWFQTISLSLFGVNPWSIRLFPMLLGMGGVIFLYFAAKSLWNKNIARAAAIILATSSLYYGTAHYANMDLEVAIWLNISILSLYIGVKQEKKSWLITAYIAGGLAFLTKGLIGFVFPAAIMGLWIILTNQWRLIRKLHLFLGIAIFALIALPWLILISHRNPDFLNFFFYVQQFQRFTTGEFNNAQPWWFYPMVVIAGCFPWSILFLGKLKYFFKNAFHDKDILYLLLWAFVVLVFFSLPNSKLVGYIIPIMAPIALLTAYVIEKEREKLFTLYTLVGIGLSIIAIITLSLAIYPVKIFLIPLRLDLILGSIISGVGAFLLFYKHRFFKEDSEKVFYTLATITTLLCTVIAHSISNAHTNALHSTRSLAAIIPKNTPPLSIVSYHGYFQDLPLYAQQTVRVVYTWSDVKGDNWASELSYALSQDPNQYQRLIEENTFWQLWNTQRPLYVVLHTSDLPKFTAHSTQYKILGETNVAALITQASNSDEKNLN